MLTNLIKDKLNIERFIPNNVIVGYFLSDNRAVYPSVQSICSKLCDFIQFYILGSKYLI